MAAPLDLSGCSMQTWDWTKAGLACVGRQCCVCRQGPLAPTGAVALPRTSPLSPHTPLGPDETHILLIFSFTSLLTIFFLSSHQTSCLLKTTFVVFHFEFFLPVLFQLPLCLDNSATVFATEVAETPVLRCDCKRCVFLVFIVPNVYKTVTFCMSPLLEHCLGRTVAELSTSYGRLSLMQFSYSFLFI